ncbi:MAG: hypothetical protein ACE37F_30170 [Nannocystaceae bacterium]|nr:hypothetical protein [bacterium]
MSARAPLRTLLIAVSIVGCASPGEPHAPGPGSTGGFETSTGASSTTGTGPIHERPDAESSGGEESSGTGSAPPGTAPELYEDFFARLPGLWVAPVQSWTSAGSFPTMNMDVRVVGDTLFSRVDLDADNSLRFAFEYEAPRGEWELVYRNGGDFLGDPRDTRTVLEEVSEDRMTWRFCARYGGCAYVDATFEFGVETLALDVDVLGMRHIEWTAMRREARPTPAAELPDAVVDAKADFPPMPTLDIDVSWTNPLPAPGDVWVILSTTPCGVNPTQNCVPSRFIHVTAPQGSTQAALRLEQLHAGDYFANVVLDRNRNLIESGMLPDPSDGVAIPDAPAVVDVEGSSLGVMIFLNP